MESPVMSGGALGNATAGGERADVEEEPVVTGGPKRSALGGARWIANSMLESRVRLIIALDVILIAYMWIVKTSTFASLNELRSILLTMAAPGMLVAGMTILLLAGAFDLSVGSVLSLSGVVAGKLLLGWHVGVVVAVVVALSVGIVTGLINGVLVASVGINPLIVTLGTLSVFQGISELIASTGYSGFGRSFDALGQGELATIALPVWITAGVALVIGVASAKVPYFRKFYYIGSNPEAARRSGIRTQRVLLSGFVLTGVVAALAGVLVASNLDAASATAGSGMELTVIAAAVLGGASLTGGEGSILGGIAGVLFVTLLQNALVVYGVGVYWQDIATGTALVFAVGLDSLKRSAGVMRFLTR